MPHIPSALDRLFERVDARDFATLPGEEQDVFACASAWRNRSNLRQPHGPQTQRIAHDRHGTETHGSGSDHRVEEKVM
jgi:hypothetical protein